MATVTRTWAFAADAEGLEAQLASGIAVAFVDNGSPAGSLGFNQIQKSAVETELARRTATGETWEDWGVPAGAVVTHVQITGYDERLATATKLTSHSLKARVVDSAGASVHSAGELLDLALDTDVEVAWQTGQAGGSQRAVDSAKQASNTDVRLELEWAVTTSGGGGNANVDQRLDNIALQITYEEPSNNGTLSQTLGALVLAAAATVAIAGQAAPTLGALTVQASGTVEVQGGAAPTLGALALSSTGTVGNAESSGELAQTLGALTLSSAGDVDVVGQASPTLGALTIGAAGTVEVRGSASPTLGALSSTAAGTVEVRGTAAPTLGALTSSAAGTVSVSGSATHTLGALTVDGQGVVGDPPVEGTLAQTLGPITGSAAGVVQVAGQATPTLGPATCAASGTVETHGQASATLGTLAAAAAGGVEVRGALAAELGALASAGAGAVLVQGTLAQALGALTLEAFSTPPWIYGTDLHFDNVIVSGPSASASAVTSRASDVAVSDPRATTPEVS